MRHLSLVILVACLSACASEVEPSTEGLGGATFVEYRFSTEVAMCDEHACDPPYPPTGGFPPIPDEDACTVSYFGADQHGSYDSLTGECCFFPDYHSPVVCLDCEMDDCRDGWVFSPGSLPGGFVRVQTE